MYLADMRALPTTAPKVFNEFVAGRLSIERTEGKFKHVNPIAKVSGGSAYLHLRVVYVLFVAQGSV